MEVNEFVVADPSCYAPRLGGSTAQSLFSAAEFALIKHVSLFESFVQCWALNYLLAKLEAKEPWSPAEQRLARRFWPIPNDAGAPSQPTILSAMPFAQTWLRQSSHVFRDRVASDQTGLVNPLNALDVLAFWRAYRNVAIHRGGVVSARFLGRYYAIWERYRVEFPGLSQLRKGEQLRFSEELLVAVCTTQHKSASVLNEKLREMSGERRGTSARVRQGFKVAAGDSDRMLLPGDHHYSVAWTTDSIFREAIYDQINFGAA